MSGTGVRIQHQAFCPEVAPLLCAEQEIPVHLHDQQITWFRLEPGLTAGLGKGFQLSLTVPVDLRVVRVDYYTLEGEVFDPPYADIHHRNETLGGLTDGTWMLRWYSMPLPKVLVGVGLGSSLPFGKTEEDPFQLTEEGLTHQHLQLGSGTFVPAAELSLLWMSPRWSLWFSASGRLPLYANKKGYQPPRSLNLSAGPGFRVVKPLQILGTVELLSESAELWHGVPYGGRTALGGSLSGMYSLSKQVVLQAQVRGTFAQWNMSHHDTAEEEGSFVQRVVGMAGLSWTFGKAKEEEEAPTLP